MRSWDRDKKRPHTERKLPLSCEETHTLILGDPLIPNDWVSTCKFQIWLLQSPIKYSSPNTEVLTGKS